MDKVLYFPHISVPNNPWMIKVLLYWDSVGSIVPYEYLHHPERLDTPMRELVQGGLVQQVSPAQYIHRIPQFKDRFLEFVESNHLTSHFVGNSNNKLSSEIHLEKLDNLARELVRMKVAERVKGKPWYRVESTIASYFMTYLATSLGAITEYQPVTDSPQSLLMVTDNQRPPQPFRYHPSKITYRAKILEHLLPTPGDMTNFTELIDFKHRHRDELMRFRNYVETFLLDLETNPMKQRQERIDRFLVDIDQEKSFITERMRTYRWRQIGLGALVILSASIARIVSATTAENSYLGAFDAALGIGSAVASALNQVQLNELLKHPLAYAVFVDQKLPLRVHGPSETTFYEHKNQHTLQTMFRRSRFR